MHARVQNLRMPHVQFVSLFAIKMRIIWIMVSLAPLGATAAMTPRDARDDIGEGGGGEDLSEMTMLGYPKVHCVSNSFCLRSVNPA